MLFSVSIFFVKTVTMVLAGSSGSLPDNCTTSSFFFSAGAMIATTADDSSATAAPEDFLFFRGFESFLESMDIRFFFFSGEAVPEVAMTPSVPGGLSPETPPTLSCSCSSSLGAAVEGAEGVDETNLAACSLFSLLFRLMG